MKNLKKAVAITLIGAMLLPLAGCGKKIEPVRARDFEAAIEEVFDDDEYMSYDGSVFVSDDDFVIGYMKFEDEDDALDSWEDFIDDYEDMLDHKKFDGRHVFVNRDTYGYILLNGENSDRNFAEGKGYYYGGIYFTEDVLIVVITTDDRDASRQDVNTILNALGYPKP